MSTSPRTESYRNLVALFQDVDVELVAPCSVLDASGKAQRMRASSLMIGEHFETITNDSVSVDQFKRAVLKGIPREFTRNGDKVNTKFYALQRAVVKCCSRVYEKCDNLLVRRHQTYESRLHAIVNESTLRYTIGDPVMEMICGLEGLKVIYQVV